MSFAAMTHLAEGLRLNALLTLKAENSLICLVGNNNNSFVVRRSCPTVKIKLTTKTSPRSRVFLEKLIVAQLANTFFSLYGT
jgi:hypothetical protein